MCSDPEYSNSRHELMDEEMRQAFPGYMFYGMTFNAATGFVSQLQPSGVYGEETLIYFIYLKGRDMKDLNDPSMDKGFLLAVPDQYIDELLEGIAKNVANSRRIYGKNNDNSIPQPPHE